MENSRTTSQVPREERDTLFIESRNPDTSDTARRAAREALILACLPIVDNVTRRFRGYSNLDHEDLHQIGVVALIAALDKADSVTGYWSYATTRVGGDIARAVSKATVRPSIDKDTLRRAWKIRDTVYQASGHTTFTEAVDAAAEAHNTGRKQVIDALVVTANPVSLDTPATVGGDDNGATRGERLHDPEPTPEQQVITKDENARTLALLDTLPPLEREVVARKIGLHPGGTRLADIATSLGATTQAVSVAGRVGWARLRHPSRSAGLAV